MYEFLARQDLPSGRGSRHRAQGVHISEIGTAWSDMSGSSCLASMCTPGQGRTYCRVWAGWMAGAGRDYRAVSITVLPVGGGAGDGGVTRYRACLRVTVVTGGHGCACRAVDGRVAGG